MGKRFVQKEEPSKAGLVPGDEWFPPANEQFSHKVWSGSTWSTGALTDYPLDIDKTKEGSPEAEQAKKEKEQRQKEKEEKEKEQAKKIEEKAKKVREEKLKEKEEERKEKQKEAEEAKKAAEKGEAPPDDGPDPLKQLTPEESGASGISSGGLQQRPPAVGPVGLGDTDAEQRAKTPGQPDVTEEEQVEGEEEESEDDDDETEASDSDGDDEGSGGQSGRRPKRRLIRKRR